MNIDSMIQGNPQALVTSYNGVLVADSLEVADRFGKRHTHVLRSIDDLINQLESQSTQNWADYFIPDDYQDNKNRTQRRFKLTRDGFSLLVMGFTGPAALHWKLLYIEAFNKMEQALRSKRFNEVSKEERDLRYKVSSLGNTEALADILGSISKQYDELDNLKRLNAVSQTRQLSYEAAGRYVEKCNRELEEAQEEIQAAWEAAGGVCPLCGSEVKENCTH